MVLYSSVLSASALFCFVLLMSSFEGGWLTALSVLSDVQLCQLGGFTSVPWLVPLIKKSLTVCPQEELCQASLTMS